MIIKMRIKNKTFCDTFIINTDDLIERIDIDGMADLENEEKTTYAIFTQVL
jgi:hypothetical protein